MISEFFNIDLQKTIDEARAKHKKNLEIKNKWSGINMINLTGLTGAELGKMIGAWKNYIENFESYNSFLESRTVQEIQKTFLTWLEKEYKVTK